MSEEIKENIFPATVVKVIDEHNVAINRGSNHGIFVGKQFAIYGTSDEEIIDPETEENLGLLEIFKGKGKIVNVQSKMATLQSIMKKPARKEIIYEEQTNANAPVFTVADALSRMNQKQTKTVVELPEEDLPFKDPRVNDKAKPIE